MLKYHIQTIELNSVAASVVFASIPQDASDLVLLVSTRTTIAGTNSENVFLSANSVVQGYSNRTLFGNGVITGSSTNANNITTKTIIGTASATGVAGSGWGSSLTYIHNYTSSKNKAYSSDIIAEGNSSAQWDSIGVIASGTIPVTTGITSLAITSAGANSFTAGSTFSLYKVVKGSGLNTEVASGGVITTSGGYTIHTFNTSGTFVANRNLDVEYLVVAGGGGGGRYGGGGGAGGYRSSVPGELSGGNSASESKITLLGSTSYPVVIGAGGSGHLGDAQSGGTGIEGTSSSFSTITSVGGGGGGNYGNNSYGVGSLGGSSGGGGCTNNVTNPIASQSPVAGQGFTGGTGGYTQGVNPGAGGGGAGQAGAAGNSTGKGGAGISSSISGSSIARAGGGSGSQPSSNLSGGTGGGGTGVPNGPTVAASLIDGQANTGGGGGGTRDNPVTGLRQRAGSGGSGVVIIRYLTP
jgi:hypothetical protein